MIMRIPAPWWRDLQQATSTRSRSGANVSPKEVETLIRPHAEQLRNDPAYRAAVQKLLDKNSEEPHATVRGATALAKLLAETGPVPKHEFKAQILGTPSYSAGVGIMPREPDPNRIYGPHVHLEVQFNEGTAQAVTRLENDHHPQEINVRGRRVKVEGVLTVFVHGESDNLTRVRTMPKEIDVAAPLLALPFGGHGHKYAIVVRDGRPDARNAVLSKSTFDLGPLPM